MQWSKRVAVLRNIDYGKELSRKLCVMNTVTMKKAGCEVTKVTSQPAFSCHNTTSYKRPAT